MFTKQFLSLTHTRYIVSRKYNENVRRVALRRQYEGETKHDLAQISADIAEAACGAVFHADAATPSGTIQYMYAFLVAHTMIEKMMTNTLCGPGGDRVRVAIEFGWRSSSGGLD